MIGSIFSRLFGRRAATPLAADDDIWDDIKRQIETDVASGFEEPDQIVESVLDSWGDDIDAAALRPEAERLLRAALAAQAAAEARWPLITDCDRLDAAFAALEEKGIVARQNFSCCGTCGSSEIWDEMAEAEQAGRPVRGYTFYHMQDTDSAVEGFGLYLGYGAKAEGDAAAVAIGHEIVAQLALSGLEPSWNGDLGTRIHVPLEWRRRLQAGADA